MLQRSVNSALIGLWVSASFAGLVGFVLAVVRYVELVTQ